MRSKVYGVFRASLISHRLAAALILAVRSGRPGNSRSCDTLAFSSAVSALRSPAPTKVLSALIGGGLSVDLSRLGGLWTGGIALAATTDRSTRIVMGDHDRGGGDRPRGGDCADGVGPTSTLQTFLERSFRATAGGGQGTRAGGGAIVDSAVKDRRTIVHAYSGNEACDADSICSAIVMAFLQDRLASVVEGGSDDLRPRVQHVPVMPIPRADLALRREVLVLLEMCGINPSAVAFIDDVDLPGLQAEGRLRLTLMDHNAVSGSLEGLDDAVVEIVDHHMDLGKHVNVRESLRDIAFDVDDGVGRPLVGSCCSLVAERILEKAPDLLSPDVARLLLGVILIDTSNLDVTAGRARPRDVAAAEELSICVAGDDVPNAHPVEELFDTLRDAKFNPDFWGTLSVRDCLRYDYKQFSSHPSATSGSSTNDGGDDGRKKTFGMSSILCRVEALAEKPRAAALLREFALERAVDSLVVMTTTLDGQGELRKELLVFADHEKRSEEVRGFMESSPEVAFLKLRRGVSEEGSCKRLFCDGSSVVAGGGPLENGWFLWWELGNALPSRKQIAPMMMSFYESLG